MTVIFRVFNFCAINRLIEYSLTRTRLTTINLFDRQRKSWSKYEEPPIDILSEKSNGEFIRVKQLIRNIPFGKCDSRIAYRITTDSPQAHSGTHYQNTTSKKPKHLFLSCDLTLIEADCAKYSTAPQKKIGNNNSNKYKNAISQSPQNHSISAGS